MPRFASVRLAAARIILAAALVGCSTTALAQAWTPAQGEGSVSLQLQDAFVKYHQLPTVRLDRGHIESQTLLMDVIYGVTDRLAIRASLPYVASRYNGTRAHTLPPDFTQPNPLDDGS